MQNGESGLYKAISALGKVIGVGVAIMGTPAVFGATRAPMLRYFSKAWGGDVAYWLTWAMCAVQALVLYTATSLIFTASIVSLMTWFGARRFRGA